MYAIRKARFSATTAQSSAFTPPPAPVLEPVSWQLTSQLEGLKEEKASAAWAQQSRKAAPLAFFPENREFC